jgi:hypothetical protein
MLKLGVKNDQNLVLKNRPKNELKIVKIGGVKKWVKIDQKCHFAGGAKIVQKCQKSTSGTPDPQKQNFR